MYGQKYYEPSEHNTITLKAQGRSGIFEKHVILGDTLGVTTEEGVG